jgi:hypothetical protein
VNTARADRSYIRAVEAAWSRLVGRAVVVSPREFEAIDGWRRRGIPLTIVLEALAALGKRRSGHPPRSLTALGPAIDEAFAVVASGRVATTVTDPAPPRSEARRAWETALSGSPADAPLRTLLTGLLAEEARGAEPSALDAALDASLPASVSEAQLAVAQEETRSRLAEFRSRMSGEEFRSTFDRALAERLRVMLALPRMSLTR